MEANGASSSSEMGHGGIWTNSIIISLLNKLGKCFLESYVGLRTDFASGRDGNHVPTQAPLKR
jgi:hypothetical protein